MRYYSPLRYPGGKRKISGYFKDIFKKNALYDAVYVEPYAGGAAVGLSLLFDEYVSKIIINDVDKSIFAFWYSIINNTDKFCIMIKETPINIKEWKKQKEIQKKGSSNLLRLGFSTFFLNRTNISGIINGGVIGGIEQKGKWKIDARFNKEDLIRRIKRIALYNDRIKVYNKDAKELVRILSTSLSSNVLFYLDPPYYVKGKDLYLNYYNHNDHKQICSQIKKIKSQKWVITYDNVKPIRDIYKKFRKRKFSINYSAGKTSNGEEIMIFSDNINIAETTILKKVLI